MSWTDKTERTKGTEGLARRSFSGVWLSPPHTGEQEAAEVTVTSGLKRRAGLASSSHFLTLESKLLPRQSEFSFLTKS